MKKFRLAVCIVGLCVSISALVFGVYSAVNKSFSLVGSIEYQITDAYVDIETKLYKSPTQMSQQDLSSKITLIEGEEFGAEITGLDYVESSKKYTSTTIDKNFTYTSSKLEFTGDEEDPCFAYFFVVSVKNIGDSKISVQLDSTINGTGIPNTLVANSQSKTVENRDESTIYVLAIALDNPKIEIEREQLKYLINIETIQN